MVQADVWLQNQTLVPTAKFGIVAGRSGRRDVQRGDDPGGVGGRHHPGEETLCDADGPHHAR